MSEERGQQLEPEQDNRQAENEQPDLDTDTEGDVSQNKRQDSEQKMANEQWLRRIPDDPGGLLKRKFKYQYSQQPNQYTGEKQW